MAELTEKKIGIITTPDRYKSFKALFADSETDYIPRLDVDDAEVPDYLATLTKWDRNGYDAAIIDDKVMHDESRFVAEMTTFFNSPRIKVAHLRILFLATKERDWNDEVVAALLRNGAYDVVLPFKDKEPLATLVDLVSYPRKRSDMITLLPKDNSLVLRISQESKPVAQPDVAEQITHEERVRRLARGQSIISVSSTRPYAGATHCSIALARTLVILGQEPAVVLNSKTFQSFVTSYEVDLKRGDRCEINGIVFYDGGDVPDPSAVPWTKHSHVVLDIGYIAWGKASSDAFFKKALDTFSNADRKIVYVPAGNPSDITYFRHFLRARRKYLNQYALVFFGATEPIYEKLVGAATQVAENVYAWRMPYIPWVLSMTKEQYLENEDVLFNALRQVLPRADVEDFDARKNAQDDTVDDNYKKPRLGFLSRKARHS